MVNKINNGGNKMVIDGQAIKRKLKKDDRTLSYLARRIEVSQPRLYYWVNGYYQPNDDIYLKLIAVVLNTTVNEITKKGDQIT